MIAAKLDEYGKMAWIAVMVLGFIAWWPIGLAVLFYLIGSGRMRDWRGGSRGRWYNADNQGVGWSGGGGCGWGRRARSAYGASGNAAFDEYRRETLRRRETLYRRETLLLLEPAQRLAPARGGAARVLRIPRAPAPGARQGGVRPVHERAPQPRRHGQHPRPCRAGLTSTSRLGGRAQRPAPFSRRLRLPPAGVTCSRCEGSLPRPGVPLRWSRCAPHRSIFRFSPAPGWGSRSPRSCSARSCSAPPSRWRTRCLVPSPSKARSGRAAAEP